MCHAFISDTRFYEFLTQIDQDIAAQVQEENCPHCLEGSLHIANYPRKPRGFREHLDVAYQTRLSFCCSREGCRRRCTPPSVRFLGRKVYLGVVVILVTAMVHGLSPHRRKALIEQLDLWPQAIARWRQWWRVIFPTSRCWQSERGLFIPPIESDELPGALLGRLAGECLRQRLERLLSLLMPLTTGSCSASHSGSMRGVMDTQKM
jgi:hypothetical protein